MVCFLLIIPSVEAVGDQQKEVAHCRQCATGIFYHFLFRSVISKGFVTFISSISC